MSEVTTVPSKALDEPGRNIRRRRLIKWGMCPCARCKQVVSVNAMAVNDSTGAISSYCIPCRREMQRESYHRRKARKQEAAATVEPQSSQQETRKELGPRKRRQRLMELGLVECCRCHRVLRIDQMSKQGQGRVGPCRECEAAKQRELRARPPKPSPDGPPPLTATVIRGTYDPAMEKAIAYAKEVLAGTRHGA